MTCHCGCNQPTRRTFLPGHDQRLRIHLERQVGGLLHLQQLVGATQSLLRNDTTPQAFTTRIRPLFHPADAPTHPS